MEINNCARKAIFVGWEGTRVRHYSEFYGVVSRPCLSFRRYAANNENIGPRMILHSSRAMPLSLEKTSLKRLPSFIKRQVFNAVIITWVFVASGLVITLLCVVAMVMIWPFSKSAYRRFVSKLASLLMGRKSACRAVHACETYCNLFACRIDLGVH